MAEDMEGGREDAPNKNATGGVPPGCHCSPAKLGKGTQ